MAKRTRILLALAGLLLIVLAAAALVYALSPSSVLRLSEPLAPALFTLPRGGAP